MPNCSAKGYPIVAVLHLEFSVVDGRSGEGVDKFNLLKRERGRKERRREREVTDGQTRTRDGERETVLKSPASVQKLDSPRLDGTRRDASPPGGESTSDTSVCMQTCVQQHCEEGRGSKMVLFAALEGRVAALP